MISLIYAALTIICAGIVVYNVWTMFVDRKEKEKYVIIIMLILLTANFIIAIHSFVHLIGVETGIGEIDNIFPFLALAIISLGYLFPSLVLHSKFGDKQLIEK